MCAVCKKGSVEGGGGRNMREHSGRLFGGVSVEEVNVKKYTEGMGKCAWRTVVWGRGK